MTRKQNGGSEAGASPERGDIAHDCESNDDARLIVLERHDVPANEKYISAINATVAEANPEYPENDPVYSVAFVEGIEDALGVGWEPDDVLDLAESGDLERAQIKTYAYPESRLEPVSDADDENDDVRSDGGENTIIDAHGDEVPARSEPADFGGGEGGMDVL